MLRRIRRIPLTTSRCATSALLLAIVVGSVNAADPSKSPAIGAQSKPADGIPVHVGSKTGEAWNANRLKIDFLWCEPGKFVMGSPKDELERNEDEAQVEVTLTSGFWLGKYEVTQEQWRKVMQTEPWTNQERVRIAPDSPACYVSWDDAYLFCSELTRQERESGTLPDGWEYNLPTEAQWEFACRAGTTTKFSYGDNDQKLFDYAWYGEQDREPKEMNARAVGRKLPNPWGFYDMHGNVVEWTRDRYNPTYPGGVDPYVGADFNNRVTLRGGEWRLPLRWSRSACRQNLPPSAHKNTVGFRISLQKSHTTQSLPEPAVKLAIVSFENVGTSVAYQRFGPALASMLASDLAQLADLEVLERQSAQDLAKESALSQTGVTTGSAAGKKKEVAAYVLSGTCAVQEENLSVTARLARPGFAKADAEWKLQGSVDELFRLETDLSSKILAALKIGTEQRPAPPPLNGPAPVLAIMPLANNSATARLDDMQIAFAEMLQASLGEIDGVQLVERQKLDAIIAEQDLTLSGLVDPQAALQIGKLAGAQRLLTGSFLELGKQLNLQVRIVDTGNGAVVGSAKVTGSSDDFAELLDELLRQIATRLAVPLPAESDQTSETDLYGRTLESTIHRNEGDRFRNTGNPAKAAEAYQRALLIEPYNFITHIHLIDVQMQLNDNAGAITTGEHALQYPNEFARCVQTWNLLIPLAHAYSNTGRYDAIAALLEKYRDSSDTFRMEGTRVLADGRIKQKRFPEATALMEKLAEDDVARNGVLKSDALKALFFFHCYHSTSVVGIPIKVHQDQARKAIAIYERVLEAAKGIRDAEVARWADQLMPMALNLTTISNDNLHVPYLTPEQKAEYQRRELEVFGWLPKAGLAETFDLAVESEKQGSWQAAVDAYQRFLDASVSVSYDDVRPENLAVFGDWIDKRIESQYRIGRILGFQLNRPDEARKAFDTLVRDYGLSHYPGPDARVDMHALRATPQFPPDCALVVGGGNSSNLNGWKIILGAEQLRMHAQRKPQLTLGDLAPYRVVIVNHSGNIPFLPSEVLALRTYVASGGSALVIVSPIWSEAAPCLHNSLLTLFDMQAGGPTIESARATKITPHPITAGITEFTARKAVGLQAPEETVLVRSGDTALLAARNYGQGRVVVAGVGQWYTPETLLIPEVTEAPPRNIVGSSTGDQYFEYIRGLAPESPLLRQSLHWLNESQQRAPAFTNWYKQWQAAVEVFCQAQARIMPSSARIIDWNELPEVFDRLVDSAPNAELKELSLWIAGECLMENGYLNTSPYAERFDGTRTHLHLQWSLRRVQDYTLPCDPKYFERLVNDFRDSRMHPYAEFRRACADHRDDPRNSTDFNPNDFAAVARLVKPFEKLKLEPGTYAHAWTQLQVGMLYFAIDDYEHAAPAFEVVAETMPVSAEKGLALFDLAKCRALQLNFNDARRRLTELNGLPSFDCNWGDTPYLANSMWARHFLQRTGTDTRNFAEILGEDMLKLEKNDEFQKWRAERNERASIMQR